MQLKRHIHTTLTALALLTLGACSDNVESGLYADFSGQTINIISLTSTQAEIKVFYEYTSLSVTDCGVYLTSDATDDMTRYEGDVTGKGQFIVILTNLVPNTEYRVQSYLMYSVNDEIKESKGEIITFHTLVKPTFGDINPPIVG